MRSPSSARPGVPRGPRGPLREAARTARLTLLVAALVAVPAAGRSGPRLVGSDGRPVDLASVRPGAPLALVVVKGAWCPACRAQLASLSRRLDEIRATGGLVLGVSTEAPERNAELVRELGLGFDVLSDPGGRWLRRLGLVREGAADPIPGLVFVGCRGDVDAVLPGRTPGRLQDRTVLKALRALARARPCRRRAVA